MKQRVNQLLLVFTVLVIAITQQMAGAQDNFARSSTVELGNYWNPDGVIYGYLGNFSVQQQSTLAAVSYHESTLGKNVSIVHRFSGGWERNFNGDFNRHLDILKLTADGDTRPMYSTAVPTLAHMNALLADNPQEIEKVREWANDYSASGIGPMFIRLAHEADRPDREWFGNAKLFVDWWRKFIEVVETDAPGYNAPTDLIWVWSPTEFRFSRDMAGNIVPVTESYNHQLYPGPEYVDWIGSSSYDFPCASQNRPNLHIETHEEVLKNAVLWASIVAPEKPFILAEWGSEMEERGNGGSRAEFFDSTRAMLGSSAPGFNQIGAIVYFDRDHGTDGCNWSFHNQVRFPSPELRFDQGANAQVSVGDDADFSAYRNLINTPGLIAPLGDFRAPVVTPPEPFNGVCSVQQVGNGIEVSWQKVGNRNVNLRRDGSFLQTIQPPVGEFLDTDVELNATYSYIARVRVGSPTVVHDLDCGTITLVTDTDGDGISDEQENDLGTNPASSDSDFDGVGDSQELSDGSDPLDSSSFLFRLAEEFCFDWNGFLGMRFNIAEFTNFSVDTRTVRASLFDIAGVEKSEQTFTILPGAQFDLLVHDMPGFAIDSIGTVCSEVLDQGAQSGEVDGRMLLYRPNNAGSFDFVLSSPFSNPLSGTQFVQFNTFHPSLDPVEIGFFTANWLTIANAGTAAETGELVVYGQDGSVLLTESFTLPGNGRRDISVHDFGASRIGLLEWIPVRDSATFRLTLNRYLYSDTTPFGSVQNAVSLQGVKGSKQQLLTPADTRGLTAILEVSNTSSRAGQVSVEVYGPSGQLVIELPLSLQAKSTQHVILDGDLVQSLGKVEISGNASSEVVVTTMQYGRTPTAGVSSLYPIPAREALGEVSQGTYNTFLDQGCNLLVGNRTSTPQGMTVDMTRFDGASVLRRLFLNVPANGIFEFDLCSQDIQNVFGVVRINSGSSSALVSNVVRIGINETYRIATPVR